MKNKIFVACDTNKVKTAKKIINLTKNKHLKKTTKNKIYWEPASQYKDTYVTIIKEQINSLSKFLYEQSKSLNINIPFAKFYNVLAFSVFNFFKVGSVP